MNNTNYMRSVNDYSLSAHEIFNHVTGNKFPGNTRVFTARNVTSENYKEASETILKQFTDDGFEIVDEYAIAYDDGSLPGEESQYTIYEQDFLVLQRPSPKPEAEVTVSIKDEHGERPLNPNKYPATHDQDSTIVLEMYRRNNELIALTLSPKSTKKYFDAAYEILSKFLKPRKKDKTFYTVIQTNQGFELDEMKIHTEYNEAHIDEHYNDDFRKIHEKIIKTIDDDKKGLILLHGIPGSGKTSYIKQLISKGGIRKVVYIPPHLAASIASSAFISFVREKLRSAVLIIEDAEQILHDREAGGDSSAVQNLLNISDGILGDALNILTIATFNMDKQFIDKALLRKGRLVLEHKFGPLDMNKAEALVKKLYGEEAVIELAKDEECTLANIFNMEDVQYRSAPKATVKFGFGPG